MNEFLIALYFIVFGLLIGSFLNVVILRLPLGKDLVFKRSACPKCHAQLKWYHNLPVFSFLILKGKCSFCSAPISWRYPLIETLTALLSYWLMPEVLNAASLGNYIFYFTIACVFLCHFFIDLDHHLLLDSLNLYLLILFGIYALFHYQWVYWVSGGLIGFGIPLLVTWLFYKIRGQIGLGGGDIKLFGVLGVFLGPTGVVLTIFLSCLLGSVIGLLLIAMKKMSREKPMAFGPAILIVAAFQIFFPEYASEVQKFLLQP